MLMREHRRYDSHEDILRAVDMFDRIEFQEGPSGHREETLHVGPGVVRITSRNTLHDEYADIEPLLQGDYGNDTSANKAPITEWSWNSRRKMMLAMGELDYTPMVNREDRKIGMVTLTLPADWIAIAPTGKEFKRIMEKFFDRYERAWGSLYCVWKLEFQERGAPHLHFLTDVPYRETSPVHARTRRALKRFEGLQFGPWLRAVWADVCDAPNPEDRAKHELAGARYDFNNFVDPYDVDGLRIYFLRHSAPGKGSKEYQHRVPRQWSGSNAGPGRFWGVRGLKKAVDSIQLTHEEFILVKRLLRRVSARGYSRAASTSGVMPRLARRRVPRRSLNLATGEIRVKYRYVTRRVKYFDGAYGGSLLVKSGAAMTADIVRYLEMREK